MVAKVELKDIDKRAPRQVEPTAYLYLAQKNSPGSDKRISNYFYLKKYNHKVQLEIEFNTLCVECIGKIQPSAGKRPE